MAAEGIVLEMTEPGRLRRSPRLDGLAVNRVPASHGSQIGRLYRLIWEPLGGGGRASWSDLEWETELGRPGMSGWIARDADGPVGMAQLAWSGGGDAAIVQLGILPDRQGRGLGGDLLSRLTETMWQSPAENGVVTRRVWLWTRPDEHPHTIGNYLARGFSRFVEPHEKGIRASPGTDTRH